MAEEGVDIGIFIDDLGDRLAAAVARSGVDPHQVRRIAGVRQALQLRHIFERMERHDPIVGVGSASTDT